MRDYSERQSQELRDEQLDGVSGGAFIPIPYPIIGTTVDDSIVPVISNPPKMGEMKSVSGDEAGVNTGVTSSNKKDQHVYLIHPGDC